jgi:transposase
VIGRSRPGRASSKSHHVCNAAESESKFRALARQRRRIAGWWRCPRCDSVSETGASNHALRTQRLRMILIKPMSNKPRGVPRVDDRRVFNGICWVLRSGAPWRDLPENYEPHTICYNRFGSDSVLIAQNLLSSEERQPVVPMTCEPTRYKDGFCAELPRNRSFSRQSRGQATTRGERRISKPLYGVNPYRGFESLPLRQYIQQVLELPIIFMNA